MDKSVELNGLEHGYLALQSLWSYVDKINSDVSVYEVRYALFKLLRMVKDKDLSSYELICRYKIWLSIIDDYLKTGKQLDSVNKLKTWIYESCKEIIKDSET